jgi:hypothetical protein
MAAIASRVADMALRDVIEIAFREVQANDEEILILRQIASHAGISHAELTKAYGRNDLSLVIGHLAYNRLGYFRPFLKSATQSDVLLERQSGPGGVRYWLRTEALEAFRALGIF